MSPRLLLDGEDLRALMLRVRDEMGPGARIVKAERVRTGGVGGFFAREHYELTVEVPEQPTPRRTPRRTVPPRDDAPEARADVGLDALLAAAEEAERRATADDAPGGPDQPTVSTDGATFTEVLDSVRRMVEPDAFTPATPPSVTGPTTRVDAPPAARDEPRRPAPLRTAPPARADAGDEADDTDRADEAPSSAEVVDALPTELAVQAYDEDDLHEERAPSTAAGLLELGIPARLLGDVTDLSADLPVSVLVRRFGRVPAVRLTKGNVVAVVGDAPAALRVATQMAYRAGLAERDVLLAGDIDHVPGHGRRLQSPAALAKFRQKVSSEALYLVVVGVGEGPEAEARAARLLEAVDPTQAWAVVDARRRTAELRRWLRQVGQRRRFDALAVHSTADAQAPGLVLRLGLPVGWLDGLPASPLVWAALLSERLAEDARWD